MTGIVLDLRVIEKEIAAAETLTHIAVISQRAQQGPPAETSL
jgi:hypothetical protein